MYQCHITCIMRAFGVYYSSLSPLFATAALLCRTRSLLRRLSSFLSVPFAALRPLSGGGLGWGLLGGLSGRLDGRIFVRIFTVSWDICV